jgi:hypothetical protein
MKKLYYGVAIALILSLAIVGVAGAITWGQPDNGEHPHVGTLIFSQNGEGWYSCTGTLLAPRLMLTAGHCVSEFGNVNDETYVRFEEDVLADYGDYGSTQEWLDNAWLAVEQVVPHPSWADFGQFPMTYDAGVVILAEPYDPGVFGELPDIGFLETLKGKDKNVFTSVGYGMQGTIMPFYQNDWVRYKGTVRLLEVKSMLSGKGYASAKFSNNPGVGGGTCYGDSGGPTFYKNTNITVSITSFGWAKNGHCLGNDFNYRTDIPDVQDWLFTEFAAYFSE